MFCVECGSEERLYGHLCRRCLLSKSLVTPPQYVIVKKCPGCERVLDGAVWRDTPHEAVAATALAAETKAHPQVDGLAWSVAEFPPEKGEHRVRCWAAATVAGEPLELDFEIGIRVRHEKCQACSRQSGDYYEAIIQLRLEDLSARDAEMELAEEAQMIFGLVDEQFAREENSFITKFTSVKGGIDFYIGSVQVARYIAGRLRNRYGAMVSESPSLIGQKDGRDLYRYSILVRLPRFREGDALALDRKVHVVDSVSGRKLVLAEAATGRVVRVEQDDPRLKMLARHRDLMQAVVVTHDKATVQLIDPETMAAVTVLRPSGLRRVGESVSVVRYEEALHIV
jgi:nonsense-mediated mRNA decay protein 3